MKKLFAVAAAAFMAAGCGIYKGYERPASVVPPVSLFGAEVADSSSVAELGWREMFTDPLLQNLIAEALDSNVDLRVARLNVAQAEETLRMARLSYFPTLGLSPQGQTGSPFSWSVPVTASWELDLSGKLTGRKRQAASNYDAARYSALAAQTALVANVASLYFNLLSLDEQVAYTDEGVERYSRSVDVLKAMKEAGMSNQVAVSQMESAMYAAEAQAAELRQSIRELENSLCVILGRTPRSIARGRFADSSFPAELSSGVPAQLLERRPDVMAAESSLAAAYYGVSVAKASMLPSLTLSGQAGWTNSLSGSAVDPAGLLLGAAASLFQPIFQGGALRGQLKISESQMEQARLSLVKSLLSAGAEVNNAVSLYQKALVKEECRDRQVSSLEAALGDTELLVRYTSTTYLEVLTAQQSLLAAQTGRASDRLEKATAVINLYRALGGGVR